MLRNSSTYVYLFVALGLLCFLFIDKKLPGTKELEEAETQLFKLNPDDVTRLEITNVHDTFIFQKDNNHWEITKPIKTLADNAAVNEVINEIANVRPQEGSLKIEGSDQDKDNLKEWGLSPAAERVVIYVKDGSKNGKMYELLVGRKTAINDNVYVRTSGRAKEPVRVIPNAVKAVLQKDLSDFRSHNVFDFDASKVTKIASRIANSGSTPVQECEVDLKDSKWTLQKPLVARAAEIDVQNLLTKILAQRATSFITDDASNLSPFGLTSPSATLSVTVKSDDANKPDEEMVLQIGGPVPDKPDQVYAQRLLSNSVFTLVKSGVDELFQALPNVRDRHILPFDAATATELSFSFGKKKGQVRSENHLWSTIGETEGRADVGKVTNLLSRLAQLETTPVLKDSAVDLKPFGLDKPQGKITIESPDDKQFQPLTLLIGKTENKLIYVRNSLEPYIYTVPDNSFDFLPDNNLALLDAQVISLPLAQIKSMTVTYASKPPMVLTRSLGGTWSAQNVKNLMVDSTKAESQASLFSQLQTKNWLGPALRAYGLNKPVLTISVETDKPTPTVLRIGAALPDHNHAAQVDGMPLAFELSDSDYAFLDIITSLQPLPAVLTNTNAPPVSPATNAAPATNTAPEKK